MRALFIGGTGNISSAVSRLALSRGVELTLLNRGRAQPGMAGAEQLSVDINQRADVERALAGRRFEVVVDFIAFTAADVERDIELFAGKTEQYVLISSASAYQKPPRSPLVTEDTPLENPFWQYSRDKIAGEVRAFAAHRAGRLGVTVVRPSLTYDTVLPVPLAGWTEYTIVARMKAGKPIVVHGDGTSLFTITHAEDFAHGFLGLLGEPRALGEAFHVTSDEALSWDQVHQAIGAAVGVEPLIVHLPSELIAQLEPSRAGTLLGDKRYSLLFDNSKLRRIVPDFRAKIPFAEGIARTVRWFEADPARCWANPESDALVERLLSHYAKVFHVQT
jgi:nucleoside-diphosphate-sugar epimerase